jgi:hypothetical protein
LSAGCADMRLHDLAHGRCDRHGDVEPVRGV